MQETIKNINIIRDWWLNLKRGCQDINTLDYTLQKLTGYYDFLGELAAEKYKDYLISHEHRKVGLSRQEQSLRDKGESITAAKAIAPMKMEDELINHAEIESDFYFLKNKLNSTAKIIDAIRQRISNLKNEK